MAALFVNTSATYSQSSPYSAVSYSEVDSDEQESHEATYPAKISYGSTSATAAYSNSEEKVSFIPRYLNQFELNLSVAFLVNLR